MQKKDKEKTYTDRKRKEERKRSWSVRRHTMNTHHHQPNQSVTTSNIVGAVARKISNIQEKREYSEFDEDRMKEERKMNRHIARHNQRTVDDFRSYSSMFEMKGNVVCHVQL